MTQSAFDFRDAAALIRSATQATNKRASGTVQGSVVHSLIHTQQPNLSIHHTITAACPHPTKSRHNAGDYYMVAYVSAPIAWLRLMTFDLCERWDISFYGPSGRIQNLPPALREFDDILGDRFYIGFDWLYLARDDVDGAPVAQPTPDKIKSRIHDFVNELKELA